MRADDRDVRRCWDANAATWTRLTRAGYDVYRDGLNTPAFLALLPPVAGARGLDLGCGEGHHTRLLAARGAHMTAVDLSGVFLRHAVAAATAAAQPIHHVQATGSALPFPDGAFDFITAVMSLMDMAALPQVLVEAHRVLRTGGFLQASIEHPCFTTPHRRKVRDGRRRTVAVEVGGYFDRIEGEPQVWSFSAAPAEVRTAVAPFRIPRFTRPLSVWLNLLVESGFTIERLEEPRPSDEDVRAAPRLEDAQTVAYFLHLRVRKW